MLTEQEKQILYKAFQDALDLDSNRGVRMENGTILNSLFQKVVTMSGNPESQSAMQTEIQKLRELIATTNAELDAAKAEIQRLGEELMRARS